MVGVTYTIRRAPLKRGARLPFEKIASRVLGKNYQLSVVLCGDKLAQKLNKTYRGKTYKPNVLSFPISKNEGEIFINLRRAAQEAALFDVTLQERVALLFVHGVHHLKGLRHGLTMEHREASILRAFGYKWHGASTPE